MVRNARAKRIRAMALAAAGGCCVFMLLLAMPSHPTEAKAREGERFTVLPVENPRFCNSELFRALEDYHSPRVRQLRERYGLDAVVAGETDEWKRILLLRHWIKSKIEIENDSCAVHAQQPRRCRNIL